MSARPPAPESRRTAAQIAAVARQPTVLAFLVALGVALLLALLVLLPWTGGNSTGTEADATRLAAVGGVDQGPTPTPRTIRVGGDRRATPGTPAEAGRVSVSAAASPDRPINTVSDSQRAAVPPTADAPPAVAAAPTSTRIPIGRTATNAPPTATATAAPTAPPAPETLFEAVGPAALGRLATGSWVVEGDQLVSAGPRTAERWVVAPEAPPADDYAVEAEFRVRELVPDVCAQSFGIVVGSPSQTVWGGGMFYPCAQQGPGPLARITDVTDVDNGYYADPVLVSDRVDLESGWRSFRLEVRGDELRLLIDGDEVLTTVATRGTPGAAEQAGFWSEGVQVVLRRFAVVELSEGTQ